MIVRPPISIGTNAGLSRSHNRQVVLGRVRAAGEIGRAEIARASGLSTQAVSNIIADLQADGLIRETGHRTGGRGLPVVQYGLNPCGGFAFGAEVRPDAIFGALLDLAGKQVFSERLPISRPDPATVADRVADMRTRAMAESGAYEDRFLGAGVVMPGPFGATGIHDSASDLADWKDTDAAAVFSDRMGCPVFIEKDANAAAMAERVAGAAKGLDTYAFLYFGTGLGLGYVHRGHLLRGAFSNAGEIGHIPVPSAGRTVRLETAVSRLSVQRHMETAGIRIDSGEDLAAQHAEDHLALREWLDRTAEPLTAAVAIIENLFDPEAIILGGAMPDALLADLIAGVALPERSVANRAGRDRPRLLRGASGNMTATLGAAALVINRAFTPAIVTAQ